MKDIVFDVIIHDNWKNEVVGKAFDDQNHHMLGLANDYENGKWRFDKLARFFMNNLCEAALSAEERAAMVDNAYDNLVKAAKKLQKLQNRDKKIDLKGGEIGEVILYGIMKHYYEALPIVPKIYHKQNSNTPALGVDSVHLVCEYDQSSGEKSFSLWMGEAKFYKDINDAMRSAIESIKEHLEKGILENENSIIMHNGDLRQYEEIKEMMPELMRYLDLENNNLDQFKKKLHIPIFIMFECQTTKNAHEYLIEYRDKVQNEMMVAAEEYYLKQKKKIGNVFKYDSINFHLILFPVPDKLNTISTVKNCIDGLITANQ